MKKSLLVSVLALGACAMAACTPSTSTTPSGSPTAPSSISGSTAAPAPPVSSATVASAPMTSQPASSQAGASSQQAGSPSASAKAVDPARFTGSGDTYSFLSPSGQIVCGGGESRHYVIGCQMHHETPSAPGCPGNNSGQPMVGVRSDGTRSLGCTTQGLFGGSNMQVLQYGESLTVPGRFTCVSRESGISCEALAKPGRFSIGAEQITYDGQPVTAPSAQLPWGTPTAASTELPGASVDAAGYKAADGRYGFALPSGKIHCAGGPKADGADRWAIACETSEPVGNANCGVAGERVFVGVRKDSVTDWSCRVPGEFTVPGAKVLEYGKKLTVPGQFTCSSAETGVTCVSLTQTPRKISLSKDRLN